MPVTLFTRAQKGLPLTSSEFDTNMMTIKAAVENQEAELEAKQAAILLGGSLGTGSAAQSVADALKLWTSELAIDGLTGAAKIDGEPTSLAALVTDTHAAQIIMPAASGAPVIKAANAICREDGVGFLSSPQIVELVLAADAASSFTSGAATVVADQPGPDGTANKAFTVTDTSDAATQGLQRNQGVSADSVTRTASIYVKKAGSAQTVYPRVMVGYAGGTAVASSISVDTFTGRVYVLDGTAKWVVEDAGLFWKISQTIANNGSNTTFYLAFFPVFANSSAPTTNVVSLTGSWVCAWGNMRALDMAAPTILAAATVAGNIQKALWPAMAGQAVGGWVTLVNKHAGSGSPVLFELSIDGSTTNSLRLVKSNANLILELVINSSSVASVTVGKWRLGRQCIAFIAGRGYMNARYVRGPVATIATPSSFQNFNALSFGGDTATASDRAMVITEQCVLRTFITAHAALFDAILANAVSSFGAAPTAWDNFDRGDGIVGISPSGHQWRTVSAGGARVTPYISAGLFACDASGDAGPTAAYSVIDLGAPATRVRARFSYGASGTAGAIGLISTKTFNAANIDYIVQDGSIHPVWGASEVAVGIYVGGSLSNIATITYPTTMAMDGTIYEVGYDLNLDTSTMQVLVPNSPPITLQDARFAQYAGRYQTMEHFAGQQSYILPRLHHVEVS